MEHSVLLINSLPSILSRTQLGLESPDQVTTSCSKALVHARLTSNHLLTCHRTQLFE